MATLTAKKSNHISAAKTLAEDIHNAIHRARALRADALAQGFDTGSGNALVDGDFVGDNAHITASNFNNFLTQLRNLVEYYDDAGGNHVAATASAGVNSNPDKKILALCNTV